MLGGCISDRKGSVGRVRCHRPSFAGWYGDIEEMNRNGEQVTDAIESAGIPRRGASAGLSCAWVGASSGSTVIPTIRARKRRKMSLAGVGRYRNCGGACPHLSSNGRPGHQPGAREWPGLYRWLLGAEPSAATVYRRGTKIPIPVGISMGETS